jgi:hypothetical protein
MMGDVSFGAGDTACGGNFEGLRVMVKLKRRWVVASQGVVVGVVIAVTAHEPITCQREYIQNSVFFQVRCKMRRRKFLTFGYFLNWFIDVSSSLPACSKP